MRSSQKVIEAIPAESLAVPECSVVIEADLPESPSP